MADSKGDAALAAFAALDIRVGRIVDVAPFPEARAPAFKLSVDFGPTLGCLRCSAQLTDNYALESLRGKLVLAVVNFPPKRIAGFSSEVLVLGVPDERGGVVLAVPDAAVPLGGKLY